MGIIRKENIPLDDHFVMIPNSWMRDERLSYKARGMLAAAMTHEDGFLISEKGFVDRGPEGVAAIRGGIREMKEAGYVVVSRGRYGDGRLVADEWLITSPPDHHSTETQRVEMSPEEYPPPKKNISKKTNLRSSTLTPDGARKRDSFTTTPDGAAAHEIESLSPAERADPISPSFHNSKDRKYLLRGVQAIAQSRTSSDDEQLEDNLDKFANALTAFFGAGDGGYWGEDYGWSDIPQEASSPYEAGKWLNTFLHSWKQDVGDLDWIPYSWPDDSETEQPA